MAPDDEYSVPGLVRVIDLTLPEPPFRAYGRSEYLIPPHELVAALRVMADDPGAADLDAYRQEPAATRDLLVCTHGAVDACCAKFGYPVYRRLQQIAAESELPVPVRVWRCTHFGGHRFAATLLDMPEGAVPGGGWRGGTCRIWCGATCPWPSCGGATAAGRRCRIPCSRLPRARRLCAAIGSGRRATSPPAILRPRKPTARRSPCHTPMRHAASEARSRWRCVLPDGAVMTQTESASPDLVAVPQYRTEVRRIAPSNGLLGNMRD